VPIRADPGQVPASVVYHRSVRLEASEAADLFLFFTENIIKKGSFLMYIVDKTELIYDLLIYNSVFDTKNLSH